MINTTDNMYTKEELQTMLYGMKAASNAFYGAAVRIGNHAFIEFTGLLNEYIKLCEEMLDRGEDFTRCNVHAGKTLPMAPHHAAYLAEKLDCIYGLSLRGDDVRGAFLRSLKMKADQRS